MSAATVQQLQPEVMVGYVVIMDIAEDSIRRDAKTWSDHFKSNLRRIALRKVPLWDQGLIEGIRLIRIDSRKPMTQRIIDAVDMDAKGTDFFSALLAERYLRDPTLKTRPEIIESGVAGRHLISSSPRKRGPRLELGPRLRGDDDLYGRLFATDAVNSQRILSLRLT
jgi:hypothetical protein